MEGDGVYLEGFLFPFPRPFEPGLPVPQRLGQEPRLFGSERPDSGRLKELRKAICPACRIEAQDRRQVGVVGALDLRRLPDLALGGQPRRGNVLPFRLVVAIIQHCRFRARSNLCALFPGHQPLLRFLIVACPTTPYPVLSSGTFGGCCAACPERNIQ